ncbi:MAG: methionyl-tRNA formyltransferase [Cyclobacteriaceae bacterium]
MMKIGLLASGNLGFEMVQKLSQQHTLQFIATDKHSTNIIALANKLEIRLFVGNPRKGKLADFLKADILDLLFSINYLFLIERDIIEKAKYPINFHGSLLPKYRGRTPHVWAIINNEKETGVTAHIIDDGCDTGAVILQEKILIEPNDSGFSLLQKYSVIYQKMLHQVIELVKTNSLKPIPQIHQLASYFDKRTPDDGLINWDWQRERIRNWVRAQTNPYPGAFTHVRGHKIIIDWVEFDSFGFNCKDPNGLVLSLNPLRVKTQNGVIRIEKIRSGGEHIENSIILGK